MLSVDREQRLAPSREKMTVAAQPTDVPTVEADDQIFRLLRLLGGDGCGTTQNEGRVDRLSLAERVDLDERDVQWQLDRRVFDEG